MPEIVKIVLIASLILSLGSFAAACWHGLHIERHKNRKAN